MGRYLAGSILLQIGSAQYSFKADNTYLTGSFDIVLEQERSWR
jgi:hypothetical protein